MKFYSNIFSISLVLDIFLLLICLTKAQICDFTLPDGLKYNLHDLRQNNDFIYVFNGFQYRANFCGPLITGCYKNSQAHAAIFKQSNNFLTIRQ